MKEAKTHQYTDAMHNVLQSPSITYFCNHHYLWTETVKASCAVCCSISAHQTPPGDEDACHDPPSMTSERRPRRGAVSAEVYTEEDAANYVKKVSLDSVEKRWRYINDGCRDRLRANAFGISMFFEHGHYNSSCQRFWLRWATQDRTFWLH